MIRNGENLLQHVNEGLGTAPVNRPKLGNLDAGVEESDLDLAADASLCVRIYAVWSGRP